MGFFKYLSNRLFDRRLLCRLNAGFKKRFKLM